MAKVFCEINKVVTTFTFGSEESEYLGFGVNKLLNFSMSDDMPVGGVWRAVSSKTNPCEPTTALLSHVLKASNSVPMV